MRLFNKTIDRQLFKQYALGSDLSKQEVVVKIFNPVANGTWFILNSDPNDPDYLWAIVDLGYGAEVGSVSRSDLKTYRGRFGLGFERDLGFDPINAEELYNGLSEGKFYADGGGVDKDADLYGKDVSEMLFLKKKGYKKVYNVSYTFKNLHQNMKITQGIDLNGLQGKNLGLAYFIGIDNNPDEETQITREILEDITNVSSKDTDIILYTNAGVDLHSKEKGIYKNIKVVRVPFDKINSENSYADGGDIENFSDNQRMIMNQNVELEHHHEELEDILEDKVEIPAWVVAKMETATQNLSDITHYLDGKKELMEEENEEDDEDEEDDEEDEDQDEIENKIVVEPINVSAGTKAELTKKFTDDAMGNLKGFLKGMEGVDLRDDYTFDYKDEQYEVEPIVNSDENGVSNAVFSIFDGDGEEVGEVTYSREGGKQKFTANSEFFGWNNAKFEDGGFMNNVYADGGEISLWKAEPKNKPEKFKTFKSLQAYKAYMTKNAKFFRDEHSKNGTGFYGFEADVTQKEVESSIENLYDSNNKYANGGYFDGTIPKVYTYMSNYAKGGEVAKAEILGLSKNIMGTTDIEMKISGMRKSQDFSVYPIGKDDTDQIITIQSETRIGKIDLSTGRGLMSQSHSNGAYFVHFQMDNLTKFTVSESDLEELKMYIFKTAGSNVGSSIVKSDNSGASGVYEDGGSVKRTRRTKNQIRKDEYNKEVDLYNWYIVNFLENKVESGFEYKEDAVDLLSDYDGDKNFKVVSKKTLKTLGIEIPNENWKYADGGFMNNVYAKGGKIDNSHNYRLLDRLRSDNDYFLGNGNRSEKHLWAGNVDAQIKEMKRLWNNLPEDAKPEWLSMDDILEYEQKMKKQYADGGFMNNVYADGGRVSNEDYEQRLQYLKMMKNNEPTDLGKYRIDKEIREINTILDHRGNLKNSYAKGGSLEDKLTKLENKKSDLESKLFDAKLKEFQVIENMGWGAGMRRSKVSISTTKTDSLKERIKVVEEEIEQAKQDLLPKGSSVKKDWWHTVVNPNQDFNNFDNKMPIDWEVDDFKSWIVSNSDLDGNLDKEVLDIVKMPKSKLLVEYLNKNGSGKNNNEYYKEFGNWQSALYDVFTQMKKDYLFKKSLKYILKADIKTVTVRLKNGKEVTYSGADVLNGNYVLAKGGDITSKANYFGKNNVVGVELKDGTNIKPVNGYWVKKGAEPIGAEPTPTTSGKSEPKISTTEIRKDARGNWRAENTVDNFNGYDWRISTVKTYTGNLVSSAQGGKTEATGTKGIVMFKYAPYEDPNHTLEVSKPSRLTEKVVAEQHAKGLAKFKKFMETGMFKGGGKISNFDKLSDKVAKEYEGKPVKSEYQEEYGKYYSKEEAQEVGDKVAGKVKAMQSAKNMSGGSIVGKKSNSGAEILKQANDLAKKIRMDGESWNDAKKRAFAQLKK
jgi:hypothetical protein